MSNGVGSNSLDNLAHIANMSHELQVLNQQLKEENGNDSMEHTPNDRNSDSNTPPPTLKSGKPRRMACVECRQQKSRCDAHERYPQPCTRCTKKGLRCNLKSDYKRTYKRARIAQIEREFSELKKNLTPSQAAELVSKLPTLTNNSTPNTSPQVLNSQPIRHGQYESRPVFTQFQLSLIQSPQNKPSIHNHHHQAPHIQQGSSLEQRPSASPLDARYSHNSSETNNSIPNTPSIYRPLDSSLGFITSGYSKQQDFELDPRTEVPDYALVCEEKSLDSVSLSSETIKALYLEYVEFYHPILPVVDILKGPERIYKLCPSLFWVIMFVSLRRFHDDSQKSLLIQLSPLVKGVLAEIMISPITRYNPTEEDEPILNASSVYSVQAFLLYSFWPPITSSLSADSSYNTVGTAIFLAIRIGLHSSIAVTSADSQKSLQQISMTQENVKTWIICNIVSQTIATSFGFPAFVQFESSVWSAFKPGSGIQLPKSIQIMMEIAHFEDQVAKTLNSNPGDSYGLIDASERLPLLKLLMRRLDEIESKVNHELSEEDGFRRFQLLSVRVHLLTYFFVDSSRIAQFELQKGLVQLYNAAIALINLTNAFQTRNKKFVRYLPGVHILNIWQAACIIGKLTHSSLKKIVDTGSGKQCYQIAIILAAKASILKHDMAYRSSGIMRNMWQLFRTLDEKKLSSLSINVRTRMSASVFFDCLHLLRDQVGMLKLNSRTDEKNPEDDQDDEVDEDAASYDDEPFDENDNEAIISDDEYIKLSEGQPPSLKSTPGSTTSSGRVRKPRSLSNTVNAESKARKIIRTIPLDPQPISVGGKRSSIFKVVNTSNDSSPQVKLEKDSPASVLTSYKQKNITQASLESLNQKSIQPPVSLPSQQNNITTPSTIQQASNPIQPQVHPRQLDEFMMDESPVQAGLENLEMYNFDMNSDLLWKDVDSVMNDFGFHT